MIEVDKIRARWILSLPNNEHAVAITTWRDTVLIATDAGHIYQVEHDELADTYRSIRVAP